MIIAFSGVKFAGKDTAAEGLIKRYGFKRVGLADRLKDICSHIFEISRKDMDDPAKKEVPFEEPVLINSDHIRDILDLLRFDGFIFDMESKCKDICKNFIGKILTSIRDMLQTVGTDICRTHIQDDIWLCYIKSLLNKTNNYVITDARFQNERDYLKQMGAVLILIKRPGFESKSTHISENQLGEDSSYDMIATNDTTIYALQSSVCMWYGLKQNELLSNFRKQFG